MFHPYAENMPSRIAEYKISIFLICLFEPGEASSVVQLSRYMMENSKLMLILLLLEWKVESFL